MTADLAKTDQARSRSRWLVLGIAAAAAVATIVAVGIARSGDDTANAGLPTVVTDSGATTELEAGPANAGRCAAPSAADAAKQTVAFEGVVTEIADGLVTLRPLHFYNGLETSRVTIAQPDRGMSEGPAAFVVGGSYFVGANDGRVAICGLTGPVTKELRALYVAAFGD